MENNQEFALKNKLLLIGGGGHCRSVLDCVLSLDEYDEIGIIDSSDCSCLGVPVIGGDEDIPELIKSGWNNAFITVGSVGNTKIRRKLYKMLNDLKINIPIIADPTAIIARGAVIGRGTFIGKRAVVNSNTTIGECAIINTGAIIEHDCVVGDFSHISPGSVVCGGVNIGSDSHIGAGTVIRQLITIGNSSLIGAGSVVVKNIDDNKKAYGNPCRVVE